MIIYDSQHPSVSNCESYFRRSAVNPILASPLMVLFFRGFAPTLNYFSLPISLRMPNFAVRYEPTAIVIQSTIN